MNRILPIALLALVLGSCGGYKFHTMVEIEGRYQTKTRFNQYPGLHPLGYTLFRKDVITDVADGRIVERRKIVDGTNLLLGGLLYHSRITTYDTTGRKVKTVKTRGSRTKTIDHAHRHPLIVTY
jgi:hypothetical protein